jgi:Skp family chaperone for outer membrane proteins
MKKALSAICFMLLFLSAANAQRYAVIDTKFILYKLPEYKDAQKRLDQFSELWQQELDQRQAAMDKMVKDFERENVNIKFNGDHKEYFQSFFMDSFYNQRENKIKESISRFLNEIFDVNMVYSRPDLDLLTELYKLMEKNME